MGHARRILIDEAVSRFFCRHLAVLRVGQVRVSKMIHSKYWARTISGIVTLEALLTFIADWESAEDITIDMYLACPPSLKVLVLQVQRGDPERYPVWETEAKTVTL
ncbi:hypothetical protein BG015_007596 [Linnemannia schmuckeri]|uniref:Uncharacterized protein n=1 Tax=Linnemannia schmuckeri TaxID=64567 RepID=A0A9P5S8P4_9FUNG|nr:hypothetical protein BG015_007596 [Linnemannia schmuckeri]